jgi:RNA polymerase sigma factor (sigma-70 family)
MKTSVKRTQSPKVPFFSNPLLHRFLQVEENRNMFMNVIMAGSEKDRVELERRFAEYYFEMRFLGFVRKHIHYEALHLLKRRHHRQSFESLMLNSSMGRDAEGREHIEMLEDPSVSVEAQVVDRVIDLEDLVENQALHQAIQSLTQKQQTVLYLLFIKQMTEADAALALGVSQQSINKVKQQSLQSIRRQLAAGSGAKGRVMNR